jgi:7-carboxy-7-deazaguanine synthase
MWLATLRTAWQTWNSETSTTMESKLYKVNDIFYTLQGEGYFTGVPAVFIRFAECNLRCSFCDTDFRESLDMTLGDIATTLSQYPAKHIVLTGGEPSLQTDDALLAMLHGEGCFVQIETNGTNLLPATIDWVTMSPKNYEPKLMECDELKVIYEGQPLERYFAIKARHRFLQPCSCGDVRNDGEITHATVNVCLKDTRWRLSLQTQNYIGIK